MGTQQPCSAELVLSNGGGGFFRFERQGDGFASLRCSTSASDSCTAWPGEAWSEIDGDWHSQYAHTDIEPRYETCELYLEDSVATLDGDELSVRHSSYFAFGSASDCSLEAARAIASSKNCTTRETFKAVAQ